MKEHCEEHTAVLPSVVFHRVIVLILLKAVQLHLPLVQSYLFKLMVGVWRQPSLSSDPSSPPSAFYKSRPYKYACLYYRYSIFTNHFSQ